MDLNRLSIAFIGAGRLAQALAPLLRRQGLTVCALASRREAAAQALAQRINSDATPVGVPSPAPTVVASAQAAVDLADLVFLSVSDDAIATTAASLRWRSGQAVVHCSGATDVSALDAAAQAGALTGGFHPLQIFADPEQGARALPGSSVAIEAPEPLYTALQALAQRLGLHPLALPPGARARYHAAAGYAASFLLPVLQEAVDVWASFGIDEDATLRALLPLARGTLDTLAHKGLAGTLSGPISRGDSAVLQRQLAALAALGEDHRAFFAGLAQRQLRLAEASGRLDSVALARLRQVLTQAGDSSGD